MSALTASLDPETYADEPTPTFWEAMLAHNAERIIADVQAGLDWSAPTYRTERTPFAERVCTRCGASGKAPCVTPTGKPLRRFHVARG